MAREQDAQRDWPAERRRARSNEEDQGFTTKFDTRSKFDAELEGPWPQLLISIAVGRGPVTGGRAAAVGAKQRAVQAIEERRPASDQPPTSAATYPDLP